MRSAIDDYITNPKRTNYRTNKELLDDLIEAAKDEPVIEELDMPIEVYSDNKSTEVISIEVKTSLKERIYNYIKYKGIKLNSFGNEAFNNYLSKHVIPGVKNVLKNK